MKLRSDRCSTENIPEAPEKLPSGFPEAPEKPLRGIPGGFGATLCYGVGGGGANFQEIVPPEAALAGNLGLYIPSIAGSACLHGLGLR